MPANECCFQYSPRRKKLNNKLIEMKVFSQAATKLLAALSQRVQSNLLAL